MSRFSPAHRSDSNTKPIVQALKMSGWLTLDLRDCGNGCPDLVIWRADKGVRLIEIKTEKGTLEPKQQALIDAGWPIRIVRSVEDALEL